MPKTLFDISLELTSALKVLTKGVATGGSTTTIIDNVERIAEADDDWNGGTAWITYDAGGLGAAPQGEYGYISDFAQPTGTITLRSALTVAVAINDEYGIAPLRYPLQLLIQEINRALGTKEKIDKTTITTANNQTEYSLPSDVLELKQVWVQTNSDASDDNGWDKIYDWEVEKSETGTANKLIFTRQFMAGYAVKLSYLSYVTKLRVATDKLDDNLNIDRIVANAAVQCLIWRKSKVGDSDSNVNELLNYYQAKAEEMNSRYAQTLPKKSAKTIHPLFNRP